MTDLDGVDGMHSTPPAKGRTRESGRQSAPAAASPPSEPVRGAAAPPGVTVAETRAAQVARLAHDAAEAAWALLFPERCVGCRIFDTQLCDPCRDLLQPVGSDVCPRCGHPWGPAVAGAAAGAAASGREPGPTRAAGSSLFCARCAGLEPGFAQARSAFVYEGVARRLVAAFKHDGRRNLGSLMAALAAEAFAGLLAGVGHGGGGAAEAGHIVVTWVPAHGSSVRSRGYNQAEVLARHLAREAGGLPVVPLARKVARTRHQKALSREQRRQNLHGAFAPLTGAGWYPRRSTGSDSSRLVGHGAKGVVMVDDVYTTGATAHEAARVISGSTGLPVYVFTFSRTVGAGDGSLS